MKCLPFAIVAVLFAACESAKTGEYYNGIYLCCAKGDGTSCCDEYDGGCDQYGGVYGDCIGAGDEFDGKVFCAFRCEGLEVEEPQVETTEVFEAYTKGCGPGAPMSVVICVACDDGVCGPGENWCICPNDCERTMDSG